MSLCIFSVPFISLTKAKAYNTYKAPQAAHRSCSGAFFVADRAGEQPIGLRLSSRPWTLTCDQTAIRSPDLPFNGLHPRNPCTWTTTHLPTPEGWKAELAWLADP